MKALFPAWFILPAAVGLTACAIQPTDNSRSEIVGRLPIEPDVVVEWNAAISDHLEERAEAGTPHMQARVYAMAHLAMRDAIVATSREAPSDTAGAVAKSAASAAAHNILVALCPAGASRFRSLHARHVVAIANDRAASQGGQIGQRIAASVLSSRAADGWPVALSGSNDGIAPNDARRRTTATPTPFVLKRVQQFYP